MDSIVTTILNGFKNLGTIITFLATVILVDSWWNYNPSIELLLSHNGLRYSLRLILTHLLFYGFALLFILNVMRWVAKLFLGKSITIVNYKEKQKDIKQYFQKIMGINSLDLKTRKKLADSTKSILNFIPSLPILMLQGYLIYGSAVWLIFLIICSLLLQGLSITTYGLQQINKFEKIVSEQIKKENVR